MDETALPKQPSSSTMPNSARGDGKERKVLGLRKDVNAATFGPHQLKKKYFNEFTWCSLCKDFIWGIHKKQGYKCAACGAALHPKCAPSCFSPGHLCGELVKTNFGDHTFKLTFFARLTWCVFCSKLLWGVISKQGYACDVCGAAAHARCRKLADKDGFRCGQWDNSMAASHQAEEEDPAALRTLLKTEFRKGITADLLTDYLKDAHAFKSFHKYLQKEHSEENLDFFKEVEEMSELPPGSAQMKAAALVIYDRFIVDNAPCMINVSAKVSSDLKKNIEEGDFDYTVFDPAKDEVVKLVFGDSWYRYTQSPDFESYVEEHVSLSRSRMNIIVSSPQTTLQKMPLKSASSFPELPSLPPPPSTPSSSDQISTPQAIPKGES